jgi:hypothetical protein
LVKQIKRLAEDVSPLLRVKRSPDPNDNFLLAMSEAGNADYLVTVDKSGLLSFHHHKVTRIISAVDFAALFAWMIVNLRYGAAAITSPADACRKLWDVSFTTTSMFPLDGTGELSILRVGFKMKARQPALNAAKPTYGRVRR